MEKYEFDFREKPTMLGELGILGLSRFQFKSPNELRQHRIIDPKQKGRVRNVEARNTSKPTASFGSFNLSKLRRREQKRRVFISKFNPRLRNCRVGF